MSGIDLGQEIIFFEDPNCGFCQKQKEELNDFCDKKEIVITVKHVDVTDLVKKQKVPKYLLDKDGNYGVPMWYFPSKKKILNGVQKEIDVYNEYIKYLKKIKKIRLDLDLDLVLMVLMLIIPYLK